jgi:hypothetical protein
MAAEGLFLMNADHITQCMAPVSNAGGCFRSGKGEINLCLLLWRGETVVLQAGLLTGRLPVPSWYLSEYGVSWQWYGQRKTEGLGEEPIPAPHGVTWAVIRASAMRNWGPAAWAVARPSCMFTWVLKWNKVWQASSAWQSYCVCGFYRVVSTTVNCLQLMLSSGELESLHTRRYKGDNVWF